MTGSQGPLQSASKSRWGKLLVTAVLLGAAGIFVWSQLPGGAYPSDLSRIGAGRPALVLAYDPGYAGGMRVMESMNAVRQDYAGRVDFLVAHLGDPGGQAFAREHGAADGSVVVFGADGSRLSISHRPESVPELRRVLDAALPGGAASTY